MFRANADGLQAAEACDVPQLRLPDDVRAVRTPDRAGADPRARGGGGGDSGPFKSGIKNPLEKSHVHPSRQQQMSTGGGHHDGGRQRQQHHHHQDRGSSRAHRPSYVPEAPPKPRPETKRDDTGPLHPSWEAAKKSKEEGAKIAFQGTKVKFD